MLMEERVREGKKEERDQGESEENDHSM